MADGSAPTLTSCAREECGKRFSPRDAARSQRFCTPLCRWKAKAASPARKAGDVRRSARAQQRNVSHRAAVKALRAAGVDPATVPALESLRGCGVVDGWRAVVGLPDATRRRRAEATAVPALVAVEASPLPPVEAPAAPLPGAWGRPSPDAPRLLPCAVLSLRTVSEVSASGTQGRVPVRHLHAALTAMHDRDHDRARAAWRLAAQSYDVFRVIWHDVATAERLRATTADVRLGDRVERVTWGTILHRPRFPAPLEAGGYRVMIDAPDVVSFSRSGHRDAVTEPTPDTITSACLNILAAAGVEHGRGVEVRAVASRVTAVSVSLGGHTQRGSADRGDVIAICGRIVVECNAVAAWALMLAEVYGLGGLTAFGLGSVTVKVERL